MSSLLTSFLEYYCPYPPDLNLTSFSDDEVELNVDNAIVYMCGVGMEFNDGGSSRTVYCMNGGQWSYIGDGCRQRNGKI